MCSAYALTALLDQQSHPSLQRNSLEPIANRQDSRCRSMVDMSQALTLETVFGESEGRQDHRYRLRSHRRARCGVAFDTDFECITQLQHDQSHDTGH